MFLPFFRQQLALTVNGQHRYCYSLPDGALRLPGIIAGVRSARNDPRTAPRRPLRDTSRNALQLNRAVFFPDFPGSGSPPAEYRWTRFHRAA
ncbi:hypothetical protein SEEH3101_14274 [Salmonella enterica subsp. enterica serovar Heidelberg str. 607310-1]|nr:hypothetical protein SEEH3101_14274 [Salmonella enterica subsp. enterica serovar Heidelberg str. 607310-1]